MLGSGLFLKRLLVIPEAGTPEAVTELPVNPASPSAQNLGQQLASCRPAVGMRQASNQESLQLRSSLHLKRGPAQTPRKVQLLMEGCWLSSGKLISMEQMMFYLVFICTTAAMYGNGMALQE